MSRPARSASQAAVELRAMTVAHLEKVMGIEQQAYAFPWSRGNVTDSLASGHAAWLLLAPDTGQARRADREPQVLGYYVAMLGVDEMHLLNITVHPAHQGQGWGRLMLAHLSKQALAQGAGVLWLEVRQSNLRARQLYERWGFVAVGQRKAYYPAGAGQREDAVVMRCDLAERRHELNIAQPAGLSANGVR
jgi:[ribosomal protein S18]-alanine N-acetyltransferase